LFISILLSETLHGRVRKAKQSKAVAPAAPAAPATSTREQPLVLT
jgi:hypothetical protein